MIYMLIKGKRLDEKGWGEKEGGGQGTRIMKGIDVLLAPLSEELTGFESQ